MLRSALFVIALVVTAVSSGGVAAASASDAQTYSVLYKRDVSLREAHRAIARSGGTIVRENTAIGFATVQSTSPRFLTRAIRDRAFAGAAVNNPVGRVPDAPPKPDPIEAFGAQPREPLGAAGTLATSNPAADPLASLQWNMQMVNATVSGSYARQRGSHAVRVGIMDSGIDATHPDIAPNFDRALSRNFTVDNPLIDGPCESDPDGSCQDPPDVDEQGHGTHVSGIVGAALNGRGVAGVAPDVDLVNIRVSQDSGYVFMQPVVDALTYAGDNGIDVVNMSFWIDPYWMNCPANPADSLSEQATQRLLVGTTQRAIDYARAHGVTIIGLTGNENTDLGHPTTDDLSPTYPPGTSRHRDVDNTCKVMPTEANGTIALSALGPSGRKAVYSNYGIEQTDLSAPGGDRREGYGTPSYNAPENRVLSSFPESVGRAEGLIDANGNPTTPLIVAQGGAYYFWAQGTSMAAPHATGVAALIVAQQGSRDAVHGGLTMSPDAVEASLRRGAIDTPCPSPPTLVYPDPDLGPQFTATCEGTPDRNGFYGDGIVNAMGFNR